MSSKACFQCGAQNPHASDFCASCGNPLALNTLISKLVDDKLRGAIQDRDVLEAASTQSVFDAVYNRFNLYGKIFVGLLVIVGIGSTWNIHSALNAVDVAKKETLAKVRALNDTIDQSRNQIEAASKLEPQIESLEGQLKNANEEIEKQKKITENSETFIKSIFSSHIRILFDPNKMDDQDFRVLPPRANGNVTGIYILLPSAPIPETVELLYHVFQQPPTTYTVVHNLIMFRWGESMDNLKKYQLIASYFPDKSDKEGIQKLEIKADHVFADGQMLPRLDGDPDFHGNKWMNEDGSLKVFDLTKSSQ